MHRQLGRAAWTHSFHIHPPDHLMHTPNACHSRRLQPVALHEPRQRVCQLVPREQPALGGARGGGGGALQQGCGRVCVWHRAVGAPRVGGAMVPRGPQRLPDYDVPQGRPPPGAAAARRAPRAAAAAGGGAGLHPADRGLLGRRPRGTAAV
ncbi:MAG: hypothetical protein J3K34DRAFT_41925 [Monoraphidium minutum]|nr:MAG: hypothetical protein J3K34DRAFT_41925 [Monoraphidium minutum]